jgi:molybdate transport system substrate-binding protein
MRTLALLLLLVCLPARSETPLRVAVAANFRQVLEQINDEFTASTGQPVVLSSASTGMLYSQIIYGAPFDVFFAADRATPTRLTGAPSPPFCYARGSLVLTGADSRLEDLANRDLSLAIANPTTAPYGRAASEILARPEFSAAQGRKLVRGSNVVQAYQFWYSGGTDLALVPRALVPRALAPEATPIPTAWHQPIEQHAVALRQSEAVDAYLNWIRSDTVRAQIHNAGYLPCP